MKLLLRSCTFLRTLDIDVYEQKYLLVQAFQTRNVSESKKKKPKLQRRLRNVPQDEQNDINKEVVKKLIVRMRKLSEAILKAHKEYVDEKKI